jgi:hypothetical protein
MSRVRKEIVLLYAPSSEYHECASYSHERAIPQLLAGNYLLMSKGE